VLKDRSKLTGRVRCDTTERGEEKRGMSHKTRESDAGGGGGSREEAKMRLPRMHGLCGSGRMNESRRKGAREKQGVGRSGG